MATGKKRKERAARRPLEQSSTGLCDCVQLSPLQNRAAKEGSAEGVAAEQFVLASTALKEQVYTTLEEYFPRVAPFSLILMHVSQLEPVSLVQPELHKRHYSHPAPEVLEQILVHVRRVIRADDRLLLQQRSGGALLLPDVDRQGAQNILGRIYQSISFIQAEMIEPPLARETTILLGMGSYPDPASSLEELCSHAGSALRHLTLRPVLPSHHLMPGIYSQSESSRSKKNQLETSVAGSVVATREGAAIPYMDLPRELPKRLKHLIPYQIANELRCVPVGRDHSTVTVAMADPTSRENVRQLQEITGMTIFPVACEIEDLNILLEKKW